MASPDQKMILVTYKSDVHPPRPSPSRAKAGQPTEAARACAPVRCYGGMDYQRWWSASQSAAHFGQLIGDAWASEYLSSARAEPEDLVTVDPATGSPTCTFWQAS